MINWLTSRKDQSWRVTEINET